MAYSLEDTVKDANQVPVPGALVYVYDNTGTLAPLANAVDAPIDNPMTTDALGYYKGFVADSGYYTVKTHYAGKVREIEANVLVGTAPLDTAIADATTQAELATAAAGSATAIGRYFASKAAGEAGSTTGQFFSYPDGAGGLIYAERTGGGSTEIARALTYTNSLAVVATTAAITAGTFNATITRLQTKGFTAANDGGGATYERTVASLSAGSGVWWFTAADGSKWQIVKAAEHMAAQFGALGGAGIDARPILNAALASAQVSVVNLGALTHYMSGATTGAYSLLIPSGKGLRGISRQVSWINLNVVALGTQANAIQTIYFEDDVNGFAEDFSLDCKRSGAGGTNNDRVSGLTIRAKSANGKGTRVRRVNVYNATGYGHYESADASRTLRDLMREDCQSYNCGVGHETSGDVEVISIDPYCHSDSGAVWDGGASIATEAMFHQYGSCKVTYVRPRGYGHAGAGIYPSPLALSTSLRGVYVYQPDIEVLSAVPGVASDGSASYKTNVFEVHGGRIVAGGTGISLTYATAAIHGTKIVGGQGGSGAGVISTTGATVDLYAPDVTGTGSGGIAAIGVSQQGTGVLRWHGGGKLLATGGSAQNATDGTVTLVDNAGPVSSPALATLGTRLPGYRQRKRGTKAPGTWALYNPGTPAFSYVNIDLDTAVASRALTDVSLTLQYADGSTAIVPDDLGVSFNWQSDSQVQVQIPPGVVTTNLTLRYSIIEWAA